MKPTTITFLLVFSANFCFSQSAIRTGLYYDFSNNQDRTLNKVGVEAPSFFLFFQNERYLETGLQKLHFETDYDKTLAANKLTELDIQPFFEYGTLLKSGSESLQFRVGTRVIMGMSAQTLKPESSAVFPMRNFGQSAALAVSPGVMKRLGERLLFDAGFIYNAYAVERQIVHIDNPAVPIREQVERSWADSFFPQEIRLRLGFTLLL